MSKQIPETYDYTQFSIQDIHAYGRDLDILPYDGQLQDTFAAFKRVHRNQTRRDERHLDDRELTDKLVEMECTHNRPAALEDQAGRQLQYQQLYTALMKLSPVRRRRIVLCYFHGLTHEEIARMEGVSQPSITKSINRSLKKLKIFLNKGY